MAQTIGNEETGIAQIIDEIGGMLNQDTKLLSEYHKILTSQSKKAASKSPYNTIPTPKNINSPTNSQTPRATNPQILFKNNKYYPFPKALQRDLKLPSISRHKSPLNNTQNAQNNENGINDEPEKAFSAAKEFAKVKDRFSKKINLPGRAERIQHTYGKNKNKNSSTTPETKYRPFVSPSSTYKPFKDSLLHNTNTLTLKIQQSILKEKSTRLPYDLSPSNPTKHSMDMDHYTYQNPPKVSFPKLEKRNYLNIRSHSNAKIYAPQNPSTKNTTRHKDTKKKHNIRNTDYEGGVTNLPQEALSQPQQLTDKADTNNINLHSNSNLHQNKPNQHAHKPQNEETEKCIELTEKKRSKQTALSARHKSLSVDKGGVKTPVKKHNPYLTHENLEKVSYKRSHLSENVSVCEIGECNEGYDADEEILFHFENIHKIRRKEALDKIDFWKQMFQNQNDKAKEFYWSPNMQFCGFDSGVNIKKTLANKTHKFANLYHSQNK